MGSESQVRQVLQSAKKDLDHAEWPGVIGLIVNPVRGCVLDPVLSVATQVIPPVATHVPLLDGLSAFLLDVTFGAVKLGYTMFPHLPQLNEHAENQLVDGATRAKHVAWYQQPTRTLTLAETLASLPGYVLSFSRSAIGAGIHTTTDLLTFPEEKFTMWQKTINLLAGYLAHFGMKDEIMQAWLNPRMDTNVVIVSKIQNSIDVFSDRRYHALKVPPMSDEEESVLFGKASRFIKYSIAAYGVYYLEGSPMDEKEPEETGEEQEEAVIMELGRIARYLDIEVQDIVYATPQNTELKLVGHYVAVDHQTRSVVLAIRGSHVSSEAMEDFNAEKIPFCGGLAHKGMAECALNLWQNRSTRDAIAQSLYDYDGYSFVITGQSIGAGVANLLHVKCHHAGVNLFGGIKPVCFAYASPPVFAWSPPTSYFAWSPTGNSEQARIEQALASCFNFIHGKDVAPFLSVEAVVQLVDTLNKVDSITCNMSSMDRFMMARGAKEIPEELVQIVRRGSKLMKPKVDRLKIPGEFIVWFKQTSDPSEYDTLYCDPEKISDDCIFLDIKMATDHFPRTYETALESIVASK